MEKEKKRFANLTTSQRNKYINECILITNNYKQKFRIKYKGSGKILLARYIQLVSISSGDEKSYSIVPLHIKQKK